MRKLLLAFILLFSCIEIIQAQNNTKTLVLSMVQPQVNKKIGFQYSGNIATRPDCKSILYYTVQNNVYASSLDPELVGNKLLGSFTLPDSAQAFALVFKAGDTIDKNNDLGYIFNIYQDNETVPGSYASESVFFGYMSALFGIKRDFDKVTSLYEKEFSLHPAQKNLYERAYLTAGLFSADNIVALGTLKQHWETAKAQKIPEDSLLQLHDLLINFDRKNSDKYNKELLNIYPNGIFAARNDGNKLFSLTNGDSIVQRYNALKEKYPQLDKAINTNQLNFILAQRYLAAANYSKFQQYADLLTANDLKSSLYNKGAWPIAESGNKDSLALGDSLAVKSVNAALAMKNDKPSYFTQEDWDKICQNNYAMVADTHAYLLFQLGNIKEALAIQEKAVPGLDAVDPDMNQRLVQYLIANGDNKNALSKASDFVKAGKANSSLKAFTKEAFTKVNGSDTAFEAYYSSLEAIANTHMLSEIKAKMINEPSHEFSLKDLTGKEVSLASLKGKVVILDFWATWCGPCKMSFPGMQLTMDKYKNDSNVVFLFIDTWERQPTNDKRMADIKSVLQAGKYTFHVLLDTPANEDKSLYHTVSDYKVAGIPTKFVLDKHGNIRFTAIGFDGNTQNLSNELSAVIEVAKNE